VGASLFLSPGVACVESIDVIDDRHYVEYNSNVRLVTHVLDYGFVTTYFLGS